MRAMLYAVLLAVGGSAGAQDAAPLFDPVTGYRMTHYRAVVNRVPEGAKQITIAQAAALKGRALFLDVTPAESAVRDDDGVWHLTIPHATIPGAHWFPDAGRGVQPPGIGAWFDTGVRRLTKGRLNQPIVIFCLADCWMSWNAALRLHRAGYTKINWLSEGVDGWKEAGRPLVDAKPAR